MYGDFIVVDGTHGTNIHGMTLLLPCVVDAMGKTKIVGAILCHNENHDDIMIGLQTLGLAKESTVMMTDGGTAFKSVADALKLTHVLCSYHFSLDLFNTTAQMDVTLRKEYLRCYNSLIYGDMTKECFEEKYCDLHKLVENYPAAQKFVETLYRSKEKVAFSFVRNIFTAGCRSSQRGEAINSLIKHNGSNSRKNKLKTLSAAQLVEELETIINHQYSEDLENLKHSLAKGSDFSKYVNDILVNEKSKLDQYKVDRSTEHNAYAVEKIMGSIRDSHMVCLPDDEVPTCTCSTFTNMHLPCRHIAATLYYCNTSMEKQRDFFDIRDVSLRWRLSPLYDIFYKKCTTDAAVIKVENAFSDLTNVKYPKKPSIRHSKLSEICYSIVDEGTKSEYAYRVVMTHLTKAVNGINNFLKSDGTGNCMEYC
jgi:MULE transposase domain/SWIM zinc finger